MNRQSRSTETLGDPGAGPCHACAFFESSEEEYGVLLPFARSCVDCGARCFHLHDPEHGSECASLLLQAGVQVGGVAGGMDLLSWDRSYLRNGSFEIHEMLALIRELVAAGGAAAPSRGWANMGWALRQVPGVEDLVEYETRLNPIIAASNAVVICTYEAGRYSPSVILDVLRAHPMIVVDRRVEPNPLYVPTEVFLEQLLRRREAARGA